MTTLPKPYYDQDGITLYCGDCREILPLFPDKSFDLCLTDPPYGIDLQPQRGLTESIAGDLRSEAIELWRATIPQAYRVLADNTSAFFWFGWSEADWTKAALAEWFDIKGCIVWKKNVWGIGYYLRPQHEFCWYLHKGVPERPDVPLSNVWEFAREAAPIHSCQKPVQLMQQSIVFASASTILDPFCGSGTTLVAAKQLGRKAVGIELSEAYCKIAVNRLRQRELFGGTDTVEERIIAVNPSMFDGVASNTDADKVV